MPSGMQQGESDVAQLLSAMQQRREQPPGPSLSEVLKPEVLLPIFQDPAVLQERPALALYLANIETVHGSFSICPAHQKVITDPAGASGGWHQPLFLKILQSLHLSASVACNLCGSKPLYSNQQGSPDPMLAISKLLCVATIQIWG